MTNSKSTKRALISSALAILMCVAMLIGTTFAWFTDTASTGVNKIQAGNLDIEVEYKTSLEGEWETLDNATDLFGAEGTLFEPGHTRVVELKITNVGNLALKYKIGMNVVSETTGTNKAGNPYKLSDYLKVAATGIQQYPAEGGIAEAMEWAIFQRGNVASWTPHDFADFYLEYAANGNVHALQPGAAQILGIKVYMPETVGNEANAMSPEEAASISFGLKVVATQYTVESDSFDNQYDKDATYPVTNDTELKDAISSGKPGTSVTVAPGTYALPATVAAGVSIVGSGANNTTLQAPATTSSLGTTGLVISNEGVKISDVTLTAPKGITSNEYCGVVDINNGGTALENVVINNNAGNASSVVVSAGVKKGETVTLSNVTLNGGFKPIHIVDSANGTVVLDKCEITGTYTLNVNSNSSQDLVLEVKNSKLHGWTSYSKIHSATFVNTEFSKGDSAYDYMRPYADTTLTNCTFDADFLMGAGATGITIKIDQCTFGGTSVTAENIRAMLDKDDMANLKNCTIIVNGVTVPL